MVTPESIQLNIAQGMATEHLSVVGDGQHFEASLALKTIDNEYFSIRQYLDQLVDQQNPDEGRPAR